MNIAFTTQGRSGAQVGYISFRGKEDCNSSSCFGLTYPEMFKVANTSPKVTPERMAAVMFASQSRL